MRRGKSGQSVVELMLYISVFVIAIVALSLVVFGPRFEAGVREVQVNSTTVLSNQGPATGDRR
jgi:hypothetical protein